jgi:hypothetical protein
MSHDAMKKGDGMVNKDAMKRMTCDERRHVLPRRPT